MDIKRITFKRDIIPSTKCRIVSKVNEKNEFGKRLCPRDRGATYIWKIRRS